MSQFNDYTTKSKWSPWINKGCDDRLRGRVMSIPDHDESGQAYAYGYRQTDDAEERAGRPLLACTVAHDFEWKAEQE